MVSISVEGVGGESWTLLQYVSFIGNLELEDVVVAVDAISGTIEC